MLSQGEVMRRKGATNYEILPKGHHLLEIDV